MLNSFDANVETMPITLPPINQLAFFLDFDGTLVNIVDHPDDVAIDDTLIQMLSDLKLSTDNAVALVSGRSLSNLLGIVDIPAIYAAGSHGAEWTQTLDRVATVAFDEGEFNKIKEILVTFATEQQLFYEDKGFALALHTRQHPEKEPLLDQFIAQIKFPKDFKIMKGKAIRELKLAGVHKGLAVTRFMHQTPFLGRTPVFIGDDRTDEDAFLVVNEMGGITIKVGAGSTSASHRLDDPASVRRLLVETIQSFQSESH